MTANVPVSDRARPPAAVTDLPTLIRRMAPRLMPGEYVFCTFPSGKLPAGLTAFCTFREPEGPGAICRRRDADRLGIPYAECFRLITLTVHSSLSAVGFMAAVTTALAAAGIACNPISAFHHDHLLVPRADARRALALLRSRAKRGGP